MNTYTICIKTIHLQLGSLFLIVANASNIFFAMSLQNLFLQFGSKRFMKSKVANPSAYLICVGSCNTKREAKFLENLPPTSHVVVLVHLQYAYRRSSGATPIFIRTWAVEK